MENIARIMQMEKVLNRLLDNLQKAEAALDSYAEITSDVAILDKYYSGAEWWADLAADEEGRLPEDLERGVLSEDGIYNAFFYVDSLRQRLQDLASEL